MIRSRDGRGLLGSAFAAYTLLIRISRQELQEMHDNLALIREINGSTQAQNVESLRRWLEDDSPNDLDVLNLAWIFRREIIAIENGEKG